MVLPFFVGVVLVQLLWKESYLSLVSLSCGWLGADLASQVFG